MDAGRVYFTLLCLTFMVTGSKGQADVCGKAPSMGRIVGGGEARLGEWPWQVGLAANDLFLCGGTLVNNQWVLTAAQCVEGQTTSSMQVYLGRLALGKPSPNEIISKVRRAIKHPSYKPSALANDIALLELSSPVKFTDSIRPACLAAEGSDFIPGTDGWITGWGYAKTSVPLPFPTTLQKANVDIISNEVCRTIYNIISSNHICSKSSTGKGICSGDTGGPLLMKYGDRWVQAGVASFISQAGCGVANVPDGYTRVSGYQSWIRSQITTNSPGFVYAGTSQLVSFSVPLLVAVSLLVSLFQF